jgi:dimethylsulfone monooxygenase
MYAQSFPQEMIDAMRVQFAGGHGVYPLIGDPDSIAEEIARIHAAGFAGATLAFVDYLAELPYFAQEVLPRLVARGLRVL